MNDTAMQATVDRLLAPAGLQQRDLDRLLGRIMGRAVDAADIYLQSLRQEAWTLEDGKVKDASHTIEQGAGMTSSSE